VTPRVHFACVTSCHLVSHVQVCEVDMADVHGTSFFDGALPVSGAFDVEDLVGKYIYIPKNFFAKR
jgi:hypothetical protein